MKIIYPHIIESDIKGDISFFQPYLDMYEWEDIDDAYRKEYQNPNSVFHEKEPAFQYVKRIHHYDIPLKRYIVSLMNAFKVESKDLRCDFFLTKPGGFLPKHVDPRSRVAILVPLTQNTGPLVVENKEYLYQTAVLLNTQREHEVKSPTEDRLMFRIGIHDKYFEELDIINMIKELV